MLADKIKLVADKLAPLMPSSDATTFKAVMYSYVKLLQQGSKSLPAPSSSNQKVNALVSAILKSLSSEKMNPAMGNASTQKWHGVYRYYWYTPWWWNYWYYYWSPYYGWRWDPNPYDGITYIGGKKVGNNGSDCPKTGTGALDSVLDAAVDIHSLNLNCNDRRCQMTVDFTKAPVSYANVLSTNNAELISVFPDVDAEVDTL